MTHGKAVAETSNDVRAFIVNNMDSKRDIENAVTSIMVGSSTEDLK
jgi:hypothetical protein